MMVRYIINYNYYVFRNWYTMPTSKIVFNKYINKISNIKSKIDEISVLGLGF